MQNTDADFACIARPEDACAEILAVEESGRDTIVAMAPADISTRAPTGAHPGKTFHGDGTVEAFAREHKWFVPADISFSGVDEMHSVLSELAREGRCFIMRAARTPGLTISRRTKQASGRCPPGVRHARLHMLPLDLDGIPNLLGFDPRTGSAAAWAWLVSVLGTEFADLRMSAQWSSSCCVRTPVGEAPDTLDGRLYAWLDVPVGESAAKDLLKRLNARVTAHFEREHGYERVRGKNLVDPKPCEIQQPIFLATPRFVDGALDPLPPGARFTLLPGSRNRLTLANLWASLPDVHLQRAARRWVADPVEAEQAVELAQKPAGEATATPGDVDAGKRLIEELRSRLLRGEDWFGRCTNRYRVRMGLELAALTLERGGFLSGTRNEGVLRVASMLVSGMPLGMGEDWVRDQLRPILSTLTGSAWLTDEWEGSADASVIARYLEAGTGEVDAHGRDARYSYGKSRLLEEFQPTPDEIRRLGLKSLAAAGDRRTADRAEQRRAAGCRSKGQIAAAASEKAEAVARLAGTGMSLRAIAREIGLSVSMVHKLRTGAPTALTETVSEPSSGELSTETEKPVGEALSASVDRLRKLAVEAAESVLVPELVSTEAGGFDDIPW